MLTGLKVLVTRPEPANELLCQAIAQEGGEPVSLPTIRIEPHEPLLSCPSADIYIFTSQYAPAYVPPPTSGTVVAIGPSTAKALEHCAWPVSHIAPSGSTSETLLAHEIFSSIQGKKICLMGGYAGRTLLQNTLSEKGAQVAKHALYRRSCPKVEIDVEKYMDIQAITVNSVDAFRHLLHMLGPQGAACLHSKTFCVPSKRVAGFLNELSFVSNVILSTGPQDREVIEALSQWWKKPLV